MLVITSADHYLGHCITSHLAQHKQLIPQMRVLCENKKPCLNFGYKGIDVQQVDYMNMEQLVDALRHVEYMILAVGDESNRVAYNENLCTAASQAGVKSIICISHVGAVGPLQDYAMIEEQVISTSCQWTILRPDWTIQHLHLWAPYVEKHAQLAMPLHPDTELCPIDMTDLCSVVQAIVLNWDHSILPVHLDNEHDGQVYTITGPEPVTAKELVTRLAKATGYESLKYKTVRPMDTQFYLEQLAHDIWFDARIKQEQRLMYNDPLSKGEYNYSTRAFSLPTATLIDTMVRYFDWVRETSSSICVPHVDMLLSRPAHSVDRFFQENAITFKPRV